MDHFLQYFVAGLGFGLGLGLMTWVLGKLLK